MEIDILKEFLVLASDENYLQAAEDLYISQSTLSRHIKSLEEELNVQLFDRNTRKVELNDYGRILLPYAESITKSYSEALKSLEALTTFKVNTITLGVLPSFQTYGVRNIIADFRKQYPQYKVNLVTSSPSPQYDEIIHGKIDVAFVRHIDNIDNPSVKSIQYANDTLVAVLPEDHPLALSNRDSVNVYDLTDEDIISVSSSTMKELIDKIMRDYKIRYNIVSEPSRADMALDMVSDGYGVALLMKGPTLTMPLHNVKVLDVTPTTSTTISMVYRNTPQLPQIVKNFISFAVI